MTNTLLSCWEYSRNYEHVLPVTVFWQFGRLVDSKVGFNPPFHSIRGPLDRSGPSALNNQLLNTTGSEAVYFKCVIVIQSDFLVVVIGWKGVNSGRMKIQWSTT